jgi:hypothetical protein
MLCANLRLSQAIRLGRGGFALIRLSSFRFRRIVYSALAVICFAATAAPAWAQFETRATHSVPGESSAVAVADFNGDGKLDVAVTSGSSLVILLGNGDGTFRQFATYPGVFYSIVAADLNNDGNVDLVVAPYSDSLLVFLGNGDGTFQSPKSVTTTAACGVLAVGDFNGDGKLDLAVTDHPYISILLGNGDGTFQAPIDNDSFVEPGWITVGDFNNDGKLDVAAIGGLGGYTLGVLLGNGNGTLQSSLTYPLAHPPGTITAADFNGDGNLDVAVGGYLDDAVTVFLGKGNGSFDAGIRTFGGTNEVIVGDFNGDGKLDMIAEAEGYGVTEFVGNGDGTFQPAVISPSGAGQLAASGDLNNDGKADAVLLGSEPSAVITMLNSGTASFSPSSPLTFPAQLIGTTSAPSSTTLTNDGKSPLVVSSVSSGGAPFRMSTTCKGSIAPGGSCRISATFTPQAEGTTTAFVTLHDSASSKPQFVELTGSGTVVKLAPRQLAFAPQKAGTNSPAKTVQLTNTGSGELSVTSIYVVDSSGGNNFSESNDCGTMLAAGATCAINVVFRPREKGSISGALTINDSGGGSPQTVPLTGTGD